MNKSFWQFFNDTASPRLALREITFRQIFEYLDKIEHPITIVETGCVRLANNWAGDGQSTLLFDHYIQNRDSESICYTVDFNEISVTACKSLVSSRVQVTQSDSITYLNTLTKKFTKDNRSIDFLYLDSFDLDMTYWQPSAIHHLKELTSVMRVITPKTLVVVDDCPMGGHIVVDKQGNFSLLQQPQVGGKGRLVAEFAQAVGAEMLFSSYQAGWIGF